MQFYIFVQTYSWNLRKRKFQVQFFDILVNDVFYSLEYTFLKNEYK